MEDNKIITVSGFAFDNPKIGEEALKEQEAIEYVNKQLDFDDTKSLLTLYNQMVQRRMFRTMVGLSYLKRIQDYLMKSDIDPATIETIPVSYEYMEASFGDSDELESKKSSGDSKSSATSYRDDVKTRNRERKLIAKNSKLTKLTVTFIVISIVLLITVVGMFIIANTSNNPTILNYEEVILNKYSSWEQDLQRREDELKKAENLKR